MAERMVVVVVDLNWLDCLFVAEGMEVAVVDSELVGVLVYD
jgi:hypothetical protein